MPIAHIWGQDLRLSPTGDLAVSTGSEYGTERLLRRLLTNLNELWFEPGYGAGIPERVGSPWTSATIRGVVSAQILLEAAVAPNPAPVITVTETPPGSGLMSVSVAYTDAVSGAPQLVAFTLGTPSAG